MPAISVREVFLCWTGDICIGASLKNKQHHNDSAHKLSLFLMNVLFAYTRGRSEDSVALAFRTNVSLKCRGYCRSSPIVRDAVRSSPLVVRSLSESGEARGQGSSSCWPAIDASHRYRSNSSTTKLQLATVPAARSKPDAPPLVPGP